MSDITGTTTSFSEGKQLSADLRASTPEDMQGLVQKLEHIHRTAKDYVVSSSKLSMVQEGTSLFASVRLGSGEFAPPTRFDVGKVAHEQFGEKLSIPRVYYQRMIEEAPHLLCTNVNHWLGDRDGNFLLRTLDGRVRALLSDRYRTLDNYDLFFHVGKVAQEAGAVVQRLELTDERFYMRLLLPDYAAKITGRAEDLRSQGRMFSKGYKTDNGTWQGPDGDDGDWVFPGVIASNSEVGRGGLGVEAAVFRVTCVNYIIAAKTMHRIHLGERREGGFQIQNDTREAKDRALWLEARDMVKATFDPDQFRAMVDQLNEAQATELEQPVEAVDVVAEHYGLTDQDRQQVLNELLYPTGGIRTGPTVWGLLNAVTSIARDKESIDTAVALERVGADMLETVPQLVKVRKA